LESFDVKQLKPIHKIIMNLLSRRLNGFMEYWF
jgi:hypothetical protein